MSTFKQKLKSLLNDTSSLNDTSNVEKKFDQFFLRTYRKIKKDNTRQSISIFESKKTFSNDHRKIKKDLFLIKKMSSYLKEKKPIFVFAPTIKECEKLFSFLSIFFNRLYKF